MQENMVKLIDGIWAHGKHYEAYCDMDAYRRGEDELCVTEDGRRIDCDVRNDGDFFVWLYEVITDQIFKDAGTGDKAWLTTSNGAVLYVDVHDLYYAWQVYEDGIIRETACFEVKFVPGMTVTMAAKDIPMFDKRVVEY